MKCELLIMRHGKSDWSLALDDVDRPLTKRGRNAARLMADWLRGQELAPELIIASPAVRAAQTCEKVRKRLHLTPAQVVWDARLYEAGPDLLLEVLRGLRDDVGRVMLIGHNPGLELLLEHLVERVGAPGDDKLLPTAAIARIGLERGWAGLERDCGVLQGIIRPRDIEASRSGKASQTAKDKPRQHRQGLSFD